MKKQHPLVKDSCVYNLFAVVCHHGHINTGHYTCFTQSRQGEWFKFDDSKVSVASKLEVLSSDA